MKQRDSRPLLGICLVLSFVVAACGAGAPIATRSPMPAGATPSATLAPTTPSPITAAPTGAPTPIETAPDSARVDLKKPVFSTPTSITNPLFPRVGLTQTVELGTEAGDKLRFEVTLLPDTKVIDWGGQAIETRATHFMAYSNGRILEVALDFYAQADDGSVWYFGEDVFNYEDGVVVDNEGTWLAGKDGPPGMIMPADPKVGDIYRPENIPGVVFEVALDDVISADAPGRKWLRIWLTAWNVTSAPDERIAISLGTVPGSASMYGVAFAVPI